MSRLKRFSFPALADIASFMKKYWYWFVFALFSLVATSFLIFQPGVWTYVDALEDGIYRPSPFADILRYVNSVDISYIFSYDHTQLASYRIIPTFIQTFIYQIFGHHFGQVVYIISHFLLAFVAFKKLLSYFFSRNASALGALVFAFNPVALFFIGLTSFVYAYSSLPLIIIGFYEFFTQKKVQRRLWYLFVYLIGVSLLLVYTRITGLYATVILLVIAVYCKPLIKLLYHNKLKALLIGVASVVIVLPLFLAYALPTLTGENKDFSGVSNYSKVSSEWSGDVFYKYSTEPVQKALSFKEITENINASWQSTDLFEWMSFIVLVAVVTLSIWCVRKRITRYTVVAMAILGGGALFRISAHFLPEAVFSKIMYSYYPFVTGEMNWLYLFYIPAFSFLVALIADRFVFKKIFYSLILSYLLLVLIPMLFFADNPRMSKLDISKAPSSYKQEFYQGSETYRGSTSMVYSNFTWSPYKIPLFSNRNQSVISGNARVSSPDIQSAAQRWLNYSTNTKNAAIFNLKDIFIYKDAVSSSKDISIWDEVLDMDAIIKDALIISTGNPSLDTVLDNGSLKKMSIKNSDSYEFNIYSPASVIKTEIEDMYDSPLDLESKPVLLDNSVRGRESSNEELGRIAENNKDVTVNVKRSFYDGTRYYLKMSNYNKVKPFLIQLNEIYNTNWKLKAISKEDYEKISCSDEVSYSITQNTMCEFSGSPLDLKDRLDSITAKDISREHLEGNYVGNTWVVNPSSDDEMYAILVYDKQTPMSLAFLLSWVLIGGVGVSSFVLYVKNKRATYKAKEE